MRAPTRSAAAFTLVVALVLVPAAVATATPVIGNWSVPVPVSDSSGQAGYPQIVTDGTTITSVWSRNDGSDQVIEASSSTDGGLTWTLPEALSDSGQNAYEPQVTTSGGIITAVWYRSDGTYDRAQASSSSDGGVTWTSPANLSDTGAGAAGVQVVSTGTAIVATWSRYDGSYSRIQSAQSTDAGATWSSAIDVSLTGGDAYEPQLVTDGSLVTATWYRFDGANDRIQVATSADGGASWTTPLTLSAAGQSAGGPPELATDGSTITAAWYRSDGARYRVEVSSSTDGGATWTTPQILSAAGENASGPQVVTDGNTITATWYRSDGSTRRVQASSSTDGGTTWSSPVNISTLGQEAFTPQIVVGNTITTVTWLNGTTSQVQVSWSLDNGGSWSTPVNLSTSGPFASRPQLATDGATITVVWQVVNVGIQSSSRLDVDVARLAGADRYQTAVAISSLFDPGVPVVYLATGTNYPDALSAASAAAYQGGPLLLTPPTSLPTVVRTELQRLDPDLVVIVGGTGVVSSAVQSAVASALPGATIRRDAGADRYATSRLIAERAFPASVTETAFVATGLNFPDALSASAAAGSVGIPVILVKGNGTAVDLATKNLFTELGVGDVIIAGGTGVVSVAMENSLASIFGAMHVARLSGADRYATSVAINDAAFTSARVVFIATGKGYADALAGAALAGNFGAPLFVVPGTCVPSGVLTAIDDLGAIQVVLLGGTGVLTTDVAKLAAC